MLIWSGPASGSASPIYRQCFRAYCNLNVKLAKNEVIFENTFRKSFHILAELIHIETYLTALSIAAKGRGFKSSTYKYP